MATPRIWFYHDGRHPHIYRYEPPMRREEYAACIDELAGTPVEAVSFCLGEGRTVLQVHDYKRTERVDPDGDISGMRYHRQPIFITHPVTEKKALYVNRLMSARIQGLERAESDEVLEQLFEISEAPDLFYEHEWKLGDLLMWDNRCSMHARAVFPKEERRLLRRCTVKGETMAA
mgnify:CR=1 FL=1